MRSIIKWAFALALLFISLISLCAAAEHVPPESVKISGGENSIEPTETAVLTASVFPETARQDVKWESLNPSVVTIDQNGFVTAKKSGYAYIRAYSRENAKVYGQIKFFVKYAPAPESISLPFSELTLRTGDSYQLSPVIAPDTASDILTFSSSSPSVAGISKTGLITAKTFGECTITVKSAAYNVIVRFPLKVTDHRVPDLIAAYPSYINMEPGMQRTISLLTLPESLDAQLIWKSSNPAVASIDENGVVTALKEGTAVITVTSRYAKDVNCSVNVQIKYGRDIQRLSLPESSVSLIKGDTIPLGLSVTPENASKALVFEYSDPSIVSVDENGMLTALKYGETDLRISYHKNTNVNAQMHISVSDPLHPTSIESDDERNIYLNIGQTASLSFTLGPESADKRVFLSSSNEKIIAVDDTLTFKAVSSGVCTVRAASTYNPDLFIDFTVTVHGEDYTLLMPERRTDKDGIEENRAKINAVRESVKTCLTKEYENGNIKENEYERRLEIIDAAFDMYDFPWMVTRLEKYWMAENSEEGAKDFKPGIVYYGLPYTSGVNSSRNYNVERALNDKWYLPSEDGRYYVFNHSNEFYDGRYAGNDCSSFISLAIFNSTRYQGEIVKTYTLYSDDRFKTTDDPATLQAGDILVRHSLHVIMFLYWADDAHTQAVFIEQGGSEPGINTISTSVYNIKDYTDNFYHIRVLRYFK